LVASAASQAEDRITRRMLVEQAAAKAGVTVTEAELEAQRQLDEAELANTMVLAPWEVGERNFEALVKSRFRMDLDEYKHNVVRQKLLARKVVGQEARPTEAQLQSFFADNPDLFQPATRYCAAHILITPLSPHDLDRGGRLMSNAAYKERLAEERKRKEQYYREHGVSLTDAPDVDTGPEWEQSRKRALQCADDVRSGRLAWEQAVERYTQDPHDLPARTRDGRLLPPLRQRLKKPLRPGEVGWYDKNGPMVKPFYEGTKDLKPGQVSDPIRTPFGWHVVKMLEVTELPKKTYDQARPEVEKRFGEYVIRARSEKWLDDLVKSAQLETVRAMLWPPLPGAAPGEEPDPVVGKVNGEPLRRSAIWKELLQADGPDALDRLINREMALGPLKRLGPDRLEWLALPPAQRPAREPRAEPILISDEELDVEMSNDRLRLDRENDELRKREPRAKPTSFSAFVYNEYGVTPEEYRRSLEAVLVVAQAVRRKLRADDTTLELEFTLAQENYREPVAFRVSHILIAAGPGADAEAQRAAQALARQMRAQLLDGHKTWEELVAFSQDEATKEINGALPRLGADTKTWPALYAALAAGNYEKGQIPDPIRTRAGYHIVRVEQRYPERIPEFREVRARVERDYLAARGALCLNVWLRAMQQQAKVQRFLYKVDTLIPPDYFPLPEK
jgi:parvulin-like peptidyl-prolyl isomerase